MQLITRNGRRVDRQAELAGLLARLRTTQYSDVSTEDRQRLRLLLDLQHLEREQRRFAPIH